LGQLSKGIDDFDRAVKDFEKVPELAEAKGKHIDDYNKKAAEVRVKVTQKMLTMAGQRVGELERST